MLKAFAVSALLGLLLAPGLAAGQPGRVGGEFQINSYTTSLQILPAVGVDADGDFVVVWASNGSVGDDSSGISIQGQRYDSLGAVRGSQFQVNSYTTSYELNVTDTWVDVGVDADGDFVVVWQSNGSIGSDTSGYSVQGRLFDSLGSPRGIQFQVNTYITSVQSYPAVGVDADGDFVVVWESLGSSGGDTSSYSVQGQRYDSLGTPQGSQFQVNSFTTSNQSEAAVAVEADGDFVVVWESYGSAGSDANGSVQGQRYDSLGTPQGSQFQVNSYTTDLQNRPAVGVDADGDFVVVWRSSGSSGTDTAVGSVHGQRYDSLGAPQGSDFQVNSYTTDYQWYPAVGVDAEGGFVVVWRSYGSSGSDTSAVSIQSQRYDSLGNPGGSEFQVNSYTTNNQNYAAVGVEAGGDFVVAWQSSGSNGDDNSSTSIQGQRYQLPLFADGFESGDVSAWSGSVP